MTWFQNDTQKNVQKLLIEFSVSSLQIYKEIRQINWQKKTKINRYHATCDKIDKKWQFLNNKTRLLEKVFKVREFYELFVKSLTNWLSQDGNKSKRW